MTENVLVTQANPTPEVRRPADYRVHYANQNRVRITQSDIQLFFGQLVDHPPGTAQQVNEESVSVIVSPANAKLLVMALSSALAAYEAQFGEIQVPQASLQRAEEIRKAVLDAAQRLREAKG